MSRIIITGPNGAGKTNFARRLAAAMPMVPLVHFDALKLTRDWEQRSRPDIEALLDDTIAGPAWILEGGPSLLAKAMTRADVLVWLDPPTSVRAWRLAKRRWASLGRTRPELPDGNPDRLWQQYRFALRSLMTAGSFRTAISAGTAEATTAQVLQCRTRRDTETAFAVLSAWGAS